MTWLLWIVIGWLALGALGAPLLVGKERKPYTPGQAAVSVMVSLTLIALIIFGGVVA